MDGFLLINKPPGPTSHDIVDEVRKIFRTRKVGHAGTLDPFAGGLLILGVEGATKSLSAIQTLPKEYTGEMVLGMRSDTHDIEGKIIPSGANLPDKNRLAEIFKKFTGEILQIPPMHSAKKIRGQKLYILARRGVTIARPPSKVTIYALELLNYQGGIAEFKALVSSGTYIRALARDIGEATGAGGYLKKLERTAIGNCRMADSVTLEALKKEPERHLLKSLDCAKIRII